MTLLKSFGVQPSQDTVSQPIALVAVAQASPASVVDTVEVEQAQFW